MEPLWSGTRRHRACPTPPGAPAVRLIDELGLDLAPEEPALSTAIAASLLAQDAIIDGVLTDQATRSGEGAAIITQAHMSIMDSLMSREPGVAIRRPDTDELLTDEAFVAFDLLRIDGQSLLDVPLLERKRIARERHRPGAARSRGGLLPAAGRSLGRLVAERRSPGRDAQGLQRPLHPRRPDTRMADAHPESPPGALTPRGRRCKASARSSAAVIG